MLSWCLAGCLVAAAAAGLVVLVCNMCVVSECVFSIYVRLVVVFVCVYAMPMRREGRKESERKKRKRRGNGGGGAVVLWFACVWCTERRLEWEQRAVIKANERRGVCVCLDGRGKGKGKRAMGKREVKEQSSYIVATVSDTQIKSSTFTIIGYRERESSG